jgi:hypothetical protein
MNRNRAFFARSFRSGDGSFIKSGERGEGGFAGYLARLRGAAAGAGLESARSGLSRR